MVYILLDIDGVMVTTPSWKIPALLDDGFMAFNETAVRHPEALLSQTPVHLVISSTHRVHYTAAEWSVLLRKRNIVPAAVSRIEEHDELPPHLSRCEEIKCWHREKADGAAFLIIDDDKSLHDLPAGLKEKWVETFPLTGLDRMAFEKARRLLQKMI